MGERVSFGGLCKMRNVLGDEAQDVADSRERAFR